MVEYIIKSTISFTVLYSLYYVFLRNVRTFEFNRFYLLFTIIFSLAIPFVQFTAEIKLPIAQNINDYSYTINKITTQTAVENVQTSNTTLKLIDLLTIIYLLGFSLLLTRFIFNFYKIIKTIKNSKCVSKTFPVILLSSTNSLPYSFFQYIVVNKTEYEKGNIENDLILHEQAHCKQKHSIDILLIEIIKVIFWFNPIVWVIKKEIQLNHEYLADKRVLQSQNLKDYQNILLNLVFRNNSTYLASHFNFSLTKKRLIMMKRDNSAVKSIVRKIAIVPLVSLLAISLTYSQKAIPKDSLNSYEEEWWFPIIEKHDIQINAFNNFEYVFEMGETNTINNRIVALNNALFIVRHNDYYEIIQVNEGSHDLEKRVLSGNNGTIQKCYFNSDECDPVASFKWFKYQLTTDGKGARLHVAWN